MNLVKIDPAYREWYQTKVTRNGVEDKFFLDQSAELSSVEFNGEWEGRVTQYEDGMAAVSASIPLRFLTPVGALTLVPEQDAKEWRVFDASLVQAASNDPLIVVSSEGVEVIERSGSRRFRAFDEMGLQPAAPGALPFGFLYGVPIVQSDEPLAVVEPESRILEVDPDGWKRTETRIVPD